MAKLMALNLHLGHTVAAGCRRMAPYVLGVRGGIHILDLEQTLHCLRRALLVLRELARLDAVLLLVGTRPGVRHLVQDVAHATGAYCVTERWLAGTLTNACHVVKKTGAFVPGRSREAAVRLPDALVVLDGPSNAAALREAQARHIPTIALCDSNMDPSDVTYPVPANDDALPGVAFLAALFQQAILDGKALRTRASSFSASSLHQMRPPHRHPQP